MELWTRRHSALCRVHTPVGGAGGSLQGSGSGPHVSTCLRHLACPWVGHRHRPPGGRRAPAGRKGAQGPGVGPEASGPTTQRPQPHLPAREAQLLNTRTLHTRPPHTPHACTHAARTPQPGLDRLHALLAEPRHAHARRRGKTQEARPVRLPAGVTGCGESRPGSWWSRRAVSVQSRRPLPLSLRWLRGVARSRRVPVHGANSTALVTAALLLLPPGLLIPQGDVPGGSGDCVTDSRPAEAPLHCSARPEWGAQNRAGPRPVKARLGAGGSLRGPQGAAHRRKKRQTVQVSTSTEPSVQHCAM